MGRLRAVVLSVAPQTELAKAGDWNGQLEQNVANLGGQVQAQEQLKAKLKHADAAKRKQVEAVEAQAKHEMDQAVEAYELQYRNSEVSWPANSSHS